MMTSASLTTLQKANNISDIGFPFTCASELDMPCIPVAASGIANPSGLTSSENSAYFSPEGDVSTHPSSTRRGHEKGSFLIFLSLDGSPVVSVSMKRNFLYVCAHFPEIFSSPY